MLFRNKVFEITGEDCHYVFSDKRVNGHRRIKFWGMTANDRQIAKIKELSDHIVKVYNFGKSRRPSLCIVIDCNLRDLIENHVDGRYYTAHELSTVLYDKEKCDDKNCKICNTGGHTIDPEVTLRLPFTESRPTTMVDPSDPDSIIAAIKQLVAFLPSGTVCTLEIPVNRVDVVKIINE